MDLTLTEEQELIRSTARELLEGRRAGADARAVPGGHSAELWKEMAGLGWPGMAVAEEHGGLGAGFLEACLLIEELGRALVPSPYLVTAACCGPAIARHGTGGQRAEWLGAIAAGRVLAGVRGAADWAAPGSAIAATDGPDGLRLDGEAMFVPYAGAADDLLVIAEHPGHGLTALLVDASAATAERLEVIGADPRHRVAFDGVTVPAERVLGGPGGGADVARTMAAHGAAATCAEMVGGAQRVLDMTLEYATGREQFGRPVGSFQAVQHRCADMAVDVLGSRLLAYEAIWHLSAGHEAREEVAAAKAWVSEAYQRVCAGGHQVHGAIGFTAEHDLHLHLRHATAAALAFGDGDLHTDRVAGHLGLPSS